MKRIIAFVSLFALVLGVPSSLAYATSEQSFLSVEEIERIESIEAKIIEEYNIDADTANEMHELLMEVLKKYPGLEAVDPSEMDESIPVINISSVEEMDRFMAGLNSAPLYRGETNTRECVTKYLDNLDKQPPSTELELHSPSLVSSAYGDAPAYHREDSEDINCYGYAADFDWWILPGDIYYTEGSPWDTKKSEATVDDVAEWVLDDFWRADQRPIRIISSASASIDSDERRIATRIGEGYTLIGIIPFYLKDFHFMRQTSTGRWAQKSGVLPSIYTDIYDPSDSAWDLYTQSSSGELEVSVEGFYDSDIVYFAI